MPIYSAEEYNRIHGHKVSRNPLPKDCATSNYPRKLHGEDTWRYLQNIFYETSWFNKSYHHRTHARNRNLWYSGINNNYAKASNDEENRGRGVYAIRDIPKGTRIWHDELDWVANDGYWETKESITDFLTRLPYELQCDVLLWAYAATPLKKTAKANTDSKPIKKLVCCNLDEASFFNHAERPELVNLGGVNNLALRDIKKGEELLMDYGSFISLGENAIPWWDEIRNTAWKEPGADVTIVSNDNTSIAEAITGPDKAGCMDGYVKYGAPKTSTAFVNGYTSTGFVDAQPLHDGQGTNRHNSFLSTLGGLSLAFLMARQFSTMRLRPTR